MPYLIHFGTCVPFAAKSAVDWDSNSSLPKCRFRRRSTDVPLGTAPEPGLRSPKNRSKDRTTLLLFITSKFNPMTSRKSTPIPDNFSANAPYDSESNAKPTANCGRPNLIPVNISTWTGTSTILNVPVIR